MDDQARTGDSLLDAAQAGDRRATLERLRDRIAARIDSPDIADKDLAALARRLEVVLEQLAGLGVTPATSRDAVDDALAARRRTREAS